MVVRITAIQAQGDILACHCRYQSKAEVCKVQGVRIKTAFIDFHI